MNERRSFTADELREKIASARAEIPGYEESFRLAEAAAREPSFAGWLRRRVRGCAEKPLPVLLRETPGITSIEMGDFLTGRGELSLSQIDELCRALRLEFPLEQAG